MAVKCCNYHGVGEGIRCVGCVKRKEKKMINLKPDSARNPRDHYRTPMKMIEKLVPYLKKLGVQELYDPFAGTENVFEKVLNKHDFIVHSRDIIHEKPSNFLREEHRIPAERIDAIVCNPPYKIKHAGRSHVIDDLLDIFYQEYSDIPVILLLTVSYINGGKRRTKKILRETAGNLGMVLFGQRTYLTEYGWNGTDGMNGYGFIDINCPFKAGYFELVSLSDQDKKDMLEEYHNHRAESKNEIPPTQFSLV